MTAPPTTADPPAPSARTALAGSLISSGGGLFDLPVPVSLRLTPASLWAREVVAAQVAAEPAPEPQQAPDQTPDQAPEPGPGPLIERMFVDARGVLDHAPGQPAPGEWGQQGGTGNEIAMPFEPQGAALASQGAGATAGTSVAPHLAAEVGERDTWCLVQVASPRRGV